MLQFGRFWFWEQNKNEFVIYFNVVISLTVFAFFFFLCVCIELGFNQINMTASTFGETELESYSANANNAKWNSCKYCIDECENNNVTQFIWICFQCVIRRVMPCVWCIYMCYFAIVCVTSHRFDAFDLNGRRARDYTYQLTFRYQFVCTYGFQVYVVRRIVPKRRQPVLKLHYILYDDKLLLFIIIFANTYTLTHHSLSLPSKWTLYMNELTHSGDDIYIFFRSINWSTSDEVRVFLR